MNNLLWECQCLQNPLEPWRFSLSIAFYHSQEQLLDFLFLKILNHWHPLPAHLPPLQLGGAEGSGDYRTGRSWLVLAKVAAPLAACRCSWAGAVVLLGPKASPGRMWRMRREQGWLQPGFTLSITCSSAQCCCKNKPKEEGRSCCTQPSSRHGTESRAWRG